MALALIVSLVPQLPVTHLTAAEVTTELIDIGGRRLALTCLGSGSPTVILEAGLGQGGRTWDQVVHDVAAFTRVCSYDRAGLGESDPAISRRRTTRDLAVDLDTLLDQAGITGPVVLAGHAFGGLSARFFAAEHPGRVGGLILVDADPDDVLDHFGDILGDEQTRALWALAEQNAEGIDVAASHAQATSAPPLASVPMVVLVHGRSDGLQGSLLPDVSPGQLDELERIWQDLQRDLASQVPDARLVIAEESGRVIQADQPEIVVEAIRDVVESVRGRDEWRMSVPGPADGVRLDHGVLRWRPEILAAARATGVPPSLIAAVMHVESSGNPNAVSVAGARGLMQLMPAEFVAQGIPSSVWHDPATNIHAGAVALANRAAAYGSWEAAVARYFGNGCDAYGTCTSIYVAAVFSWAAYYAPIIGDPSGAGFATLAANWHPPAVEPEIVKQPAPVPPPTPTPSPRLRMTPTTTPASARTREAETTDPPQPTATSSPTATTTPTHTPVPPTPTETPALPTSTPSLPQLSTSTPVISWQQEPATLILSPQSGPAGSRISVIGMGFNPGSVTIEWSNGRLTLAVVHTDANGRFRGTITVPASASTGRHEIVAVDVSGRSASAVFNVSSER